MSEATVSLKMKPFGTPNYALVEMPPRPKQDGVVGLPTFHVRDLPIETLDSLANQWRIELYEKAGKPLPEDRK